MKYNNEGFSIVECLLYSAIIGCLSLVVFQFFCTHYVNLKKYIAQEQTIMSRYAMYHLVRYDILQSNPAPHMWHIEKNGFVCQNNTASIGWKMKNRNLYRSMGNFDFKNHEWQKKSTVCVFQNIDSFEATLVTLQNHVIGCNYSLSDHNEKCTQYIPLYNRILS